MEQSLRLRWGLNIVLALLLLPLLAWFALTPQGSHAATGLASAHREAPIGLASSHREAPIGLASAHREAPIGLAGAFSTTRLQAV
jgi:hypothetical protein